MTDVLTCEDVAREHDEDPVSCCLSCLDDWPIDGPAIDEVDHWSGLPWRAALCCHHYQMWLGEYDDPTPDWVKKHFK